MSCSSSTNNCCPEAPDITINDYSVSVGGSGANYHQDRKALADSVSGIGLVFTLSYTPVQAAGVLCARNGVVQRYTSDFTVSGTTVTMVDALQAGETLTFDYIGTT